MRILNLFEHKHKTYYYRDNIIDVYGNGKILLNKRKLNKLDSNIILNILKFGEISSNDVLTLDIYDYAIALVNLYTTELGDQTLIFPKIMLDLLYPVELLELKNLFSKENLLLSDTGNIEVFNTNKDIVSCNRFMSSQSLRKRLSTTKEIYIFNIKGKYYRNIEDKTEDIIVFASDAEILLKRYLNSDKEIQWALEKKKGKGEL